MHEPQLVPALSFWPMAVASRHPCLIAVSMALRPTPKQEHTVAPPSAAASGGLPVSRFARSAGARRDLPNRSASQVREGSSGRDPMKRHDSMRSSCRCTARNVTELVSQYSIQSAPASVPNRVRAQPDQSPGTRRPAIS